MEQLIQTLVDGVATGSLYGALALAVVLIFRTTGIVNFAQGEMAMFSTFVAWGLLQAGFPLGLAIVTTLGLSLLGGMLIERVLIRPVEGEDHLTLAIVTLGLFILLNSGAGWIWGFENRSFPSIFPDDSVTLGGADIAVESLGIVALLLAVVGVLYLFFQRSKLGLAVRAVSINPESSQLSGISVGRTLMIGWGIAAAVGALAGALIASRLFLDVNFMGGVLIYSFAAATLGGFDSPIGAVIGGWVIGDQRGSGQHVRRLHRRGPEDPRAAHGDPGGAADQAVRPVRLARGGQSVSPERRERLVRFGGYAIVAVIALSIPFLFGSYRVGQFTLALTFAVAVLGLNLLVGYGGQISLGHGAFFALGAYTSAILIEKAGFPHLATIPIAAAVCFACGLLLGLPALRIRGLYLALLTLGVAIAVPQLIKRFDTLTEGTQGINVSQPSARAGCRSPTTSSSTC